VQTPTLALALFAGLISFLSPCVLPLLPSYLGVLGGQGKAPLPRALGFVAGFSLIFIALGAAASTLGAALRSQMFWLVPASGLLIVFFGLFMLGILRIPALMRDFRFDLSRASQYGPVALGAAFGFGWSACIGPVLGPILTIAATSGRLSEGVLLLFCYTLGLAIPFLLTAVFWQRVNLRFLSRFSLTLERIGGVVLILFGVLIFTGQATLLSSWFQSVLPEWWGRAL
jgi:cytochrome c-type biogenesis protein